MAALRYVLDTPPDLVLLDLGLPDLSGYEALRMMRAVSAVPVVVVTAPGRRARDHPGARRRRDDYVIKPFGGGQIDARIRAVLRRRRRPATGRRPNSRSAGCGWTRTRTRPRWTAPLST